MKIALEEMMEKLGVDHVLHPYETQPWLCYDEEQAITCCAEVRMGPSGTDFETEIQFLYDDAEDTPEEDEDEEGEGEEDANPYAVKKQEDYPKPKTVIKDGREQVMIMRAEHSHDEFWGIKVLVVKANDYVNAFHGWEEKACEFFKTCAESIQMGEVPDVEGFLEKTLNDSDSWGGGRRGRIGRKSPKIKPAQLMGMKKM